MKWVNSVLSVLLKFVTFELTEPCFKDIDHVRVLSTHSMLEDLLLIFIQLNVSLFNHKTFKSFLACVDIAKEVDTNSRNGITLAYDATIRHSLCYEIVLLEVFVDTTCRAFVHQENWSTIRVLWPLRKKRFLRRSTGILELLIFFTNHIFDLFKSEALLQEYNSFLGIALLLI